LVDPAGQAYPAVQLAAQGAARDTSELHRPAAHSAHVPAPMVLNWPAVHITAVALADPAGQAYPAVQLTMHELFRATSELHRPAAQGAHDPAPLVLNWPAAHMTAVALMDPAGHANPAVQLLHEPAPPALNRPAEQRPVEALVDPAGHAKPAKQLLHKLAPLVLKRPATHTTAVALADPAGQMYPAVQLATHALLRATSELHRPAAHGVHVPAPTELN
jgi:hypothetical protein